MEPSLNKEIKLRKYEHSMVVSGGGVIIFGVWSVVKAILFFIVSPAEQFQSIYSDEDAQELYDIGFSNTDASLFIFVAILIILIVDLLLRFYVGRSAILVGRRMRKKEIMYIVIAIFLGLVLFAGFFARILFAQDYIAGVKTTAWSTGNVSSIVDLTSLLALIELIVSSFKVRRLRKELGIENVEGK